MEAGEFWMREWVNRKAEVPGVASGAFPEGTNRN